MSELTSSAYFTAAFAKLKLLLVALEKRLEHSDIRIICFGIGRFSDCAIARHQLAFILAVKQLLNIDSIVFHEPILGAFEVDILAKFNCTVWRTNLEGKVILDSNCATIVYSPHCPKQLTNNLLWQNWQCHKLLHTIFIGNSFTDVVSSTPSRFLSIDADYIARIEPLCTEVRLENNFKFTDIFNDTSLHSFDNIDNLDDDFWTANTTEPIYESDSVELITVDIINKLNI